MSPASAGREGGLARLSHDVSVLGVGIAGGQAERHSPRGALYTSVPDPEPPGVSR
jgi:hypothetical protein